ncbi:hypothetical protein N9E57_05205 [Gammaproteobacteria bacterium]|nr:hypothetical protein [Gammaproteobacteria bacterium]
MPGGEFECSEASLLDTTRKYDFVISRAVFHYMHHDYAKRVLGLMLEKAVYGVAILEVPDLAKKENIENIRQVALGEHEYLKSYKELKHTYFDRSWFSLNIDSKKYDCKITLGSVPNNKQSKFRFNVYISPK